MTRSSLRSPATGRMAVAIFLLLSPSALAQDSKAPRPAPAPPPKVVAGIPVNYDEAAVGTYKLPDPLLLAGGKPVRDGKTWREKRRPEIVKLFEEHQYGRSPAGPRR